MTHSSETGSNRSINPLHFFWHRFLVHVSFKSRTGFFWYQIPAPIRTLFYSKPKWCARDWNDDLWLVDDNCWCFHVSWSCCIQCRHLFICLTISDTFIHFQRQKFSFQMYKEWKTGIDLWCQFLCHGPYVRIGWKVVVAAERQYKQ